VSDRRVAQRCSRCVWTVEVRDLGGEWTVWSEWVDRVTAEAERVVAEDDGYQTRVVAAS